MDVRGPVDAATVVEALGILPVALTAEIEHDVPPVLAADIGAGDGTVRRGGRQTAGGIEEFQKSARAAFDFKHNGLDILGGEGHTTACGCLFVPSGAVHVADVERDLRVIGFAPSRHQHALRAQRHIRGDGIREGLFQHSLVKTGKIHLLGMGNIPLLPFGLGFGYAVCF